MKDPPETMGVWMRSTPCRLTLLNHHSPTVGQQEGSGKLYQGPFSDLSSLFSGPEYVLQVQKGIWGHIFFSLWEEILSLIPTFSPPLVCFGLWQIVSRLCKISLAWESLTSRPINLLFNYLTNQLLRQWIWEAHSLPLGQDLIVASFIIRNHG